MKKILLLFLIAFICGNEILWGQGLENIFVEIITPTSTAIAADPNLNSNTKTYRVFVDMKNGYKLQTINGLTLNPLRIKTTTKFYNHDDGDYFPFGSFFRTHPTVNQSLYYDSWVTIGSYGDLDRAYSAAQIVPRNLDTDGNQNGFVVSPLQPEPNLDPNTDLIPNFGFEMGNSFESNDVTIYAPLGVSGITSENMVCIGQFTTDGIFTFEIPVQIGTDTKSESYVTRSATESNHIRSDKLFYPVNTPPSVSIDSPADGLQFNINDNVIINATASDTEDPIYKVVFEVNGVKNLYTDYSAPFTYSWTATSEGTKEILAIAQDSRGSRDTATISIVVNGPMMVSLTSPANGNQFEVGVNVPFTATASDAAGIKKVEFMVDGSVVGEDVTTPYEFNWAASLPAGSRKLKARATNNNNGTRDSDEATITVSVPNNTDPEVSFTLPANSDSVHLGKKLKISATASDPDAGDAISKVEFYYNTTKIGEVNSSPFEIDWTTSALGVNQIKVIAYDTKGGSKTSPTIPVFVTSLPGVFFTTPQNHNQEFLQGDVIEMIVNVINNNPTKSVKVEFFANMEKVGEALNAPYSFNWTSTSGDTIKAICTDNYGGKALDYRKIIINALTPTISISSPANNAVVTKGNNVLITTTVTFPDAVNKVEFMINDTKVGEDNTSPYEYEWKSEQPGSQSIKAIVFDKNGKTSNSQSVEITVNALPTASFIAPTSTDVFIVGDSVTITANASDADANGTISKVEFYVQGNKIGEDDTAPYEKKWKSTAGNALIEIVSTDNHGAVSEKQAVTVFINTKPTISITSPSDNSKFSVSNNINFTAEASDVDGNIASVEFFVNGTKVGSTITAIPYAYSWTSTGGNKKITAIATDNHGAKTISDTVRITDATSIRGLKAGESLAIFPNPASDNIIIQLKSQWVNSEVVFVKILDMGGKTLLKDKLHMEELETGVKIDISSIPNGINTIQLFTDDGTINISVQFIKI